MLIWAQVMGVVDVKHTGEHELTLEWESSSSSDMIADSTLALITGIDKSPASVKRAFIHRFWSFFISGCSVDLHMSISDHTFRLSNCLFGLPSVPFLFSRAITSSKKLGTYSTPCSND